MLDEKKLLRKIKKKVWEVFQTMREEVDFLAELRSTKPEEFNKFLEDNLTREEGLRVISWITTNR